MTALSRSILTISGPSGSGKTTLVGKMLEKLGQQAEPMLRVTTRGQRKGDNVGEYQYVSRSVFNEMNHEGLLLLPVEIHGYGHAMSRVQVDATLKNGSPFLVADLSVQSVENLRDYVVNITSFRQICSIFLAHCPKDLLRSRMQERGEGDFDIERRIVACAPWQRTAEQSDVSFVMVDARQSADIVLEEVLRLL